MDKNVGSVNLEELKAAREALNRDMGIETDPNMYNDYDPEKHKAEREQEKLARAQALEEMSGGVSVDENNSTAEVQEAVSESLESQSETETEIEENITPEIDENVVPATEETLDESSSSSGSLKDAFDLKEDDDEIISYDGANNQENDFDASQNNQEQDDKEIEVIEINSTEENDSKTDISLENDYARSPEVEAKIQEDDGLPNFDVYDNFADFEINTENEVSKSPAQSELDEQSSAEQTAASAAVESAQNETSSLEQAENQDSESDSEDDDSSLDDFLLELDNILQKEEDDDEILAGDENVSLDVDLESISSDENSPVEPVEETSPELEIASINVDAVSENAESVEEEETKQVEKTNTVADLESSLKVEDIIKTQPVEDVAAPVFNDDDPFSKLERFAVAEAKKEETSENKEFDVDVLDNFKALSELNAEDEIVETTDVVENEVSEEIQETSEEEQPEELAEPEVGGYSPIEDFNFVDVMSSEEFRKTDKMSYVLGKDSEGEIVYGNLRDTCGTAVFTRDEDVIYDGFSSILLSLLLKNTPDQIQFIVCDAMFDSEFDVFNNSSYMYFNRVAKNNREIVDSLLELSKELENRYNNLVYAGVKTISAYNLQAEERGTQKMPYIVLFLNNYAKMTQFLDADRINTCLYNILKFGRIVGVYAMVASTSEIERNDINYNLPTRICYKTEDEHDSIAALGREGAESLKDERDFLYSTVYDEELRHLKVPSLTRKEIELIIENLEN